MKRYSYSKLHHAQRTYSELCGRFFASRSETARAEELKQAEIAGEISDLEYQVKYVLNESPRITIKIDFKYKQNGETIFEESKGVITREWRVKIALLEKLYGIKVFHSKPRRLKDPTIVKRREEKKNNRQKTLEDTDNYLRSIAGGY